MLESIGFVFKHNDREWEEKYGLLVRYRQCFGSCDVQYPKRTGKKSRISCKTDHKYM